MLRQPVTTACYNKADMLRSKVHLGIEPDGAPQEPKLQTTNPWGLGPLGHQQVGLLLQDLALRHKVLS